MKPIDFMDALGDVREDFVREMLDEDDAAHGSVRGSVTNTAIPVRAEVSAEGIRETERGKPFGGILRYIVLAASAAACIAAAVGFLHLYQEGRQDIIADSMISELHIETDVAETDASAPESTTVQTTATAAAAATTASMQTEHVTAAGTAQTVTEAVVNPEMQAAAKNEKQATVKSGTTTTTVSTTTVSAVTTFPTTTTVFMTRLDVWDTDEESGVTKAKVLYDQPYLLGDVDADGEITLVDYFLARRAYEQLEKNSEQHVLDAAAYDRANLSRTLISNDPAFSIWYDRILHLALYRAYLGMPELDFAEYSRMICEYPELEHDDYESRVQKDMKKIFKYETEESGEWLNTNVIVSEAVPKPVRDFYNDAHAYDAVTQNISFVYQPRACELWSDEEFDQKMEELRAILADCK